MGSKSIVQNPSVSTWTRIITLLLCVLSIFLYLRTLLVLHHDRRELEYTNFLYLTCTANLNAIKSKATTLLQREPSANVLSWSLGNFKSSRLRSILDSVNGTRTKAGLGNLTALESSNFILPHLMKNKNALVPAFHLSGGRKMVDIVIGVTTVKRDKTSYLLNTLKELVNGLSGIEKARTLIIVMIGEINLEYVLETARNIEDKFPEEVDSGLIEIISPLKSYYPSMEISATLGDSLKRTLWRSKHVLDCIYVMAYGHTKGNYYLIMEDDILAKNGYMTQMKRFIGFNERFKKRWLILYFCHSFNGMGKLLRSADVGHFIKYLQLFYDNMPLDFLIEGYLYDKACSMGKYAKSCYASVDKIKAISPDSLFKHVGLFSSLKGKIQKVEDYRYTSGATFYSYVNPPLKYINCAIREIPDHTIEMAYEGKSYFMGIKPRKGSVIEFWFREPTILKGYRIQSGNYLHKNYIFYNSVVEVFPLSKNFTIVGVFDEFGYSEAFLDDFGPLEAIRLRTTDDLKMRNVILSQIELVSEKSPAGP